jgi:hypothetical protein
MLQLLLLHVSLPLHCISIVTLRCYEVLICHLATEKPLAEVSHCPKYKFGHRLFVFHNKNYSYTCVAISSMIRFVRFIIYPKQYVIIN